MQGNEPEICAHRKVYSRRPVGTPYLPGGSLQPVGGRDSPFVNLREVIELKRVYWPLGRWQEYILNHFNHKTINAYTEGLHTKMERIKRLSYGYKNVEAYIKKVLLSFIAAAILPLLICPSFSWRAKFRFDKPSDMWYIRYLEKGWEAPYSTWSVMLSTTGLA